MKPNPTAKHLKVRVSAFLLVLHMLYSGCALALTFGAVYNTESLNLRSDGSSSSAWLGAYSRGTWVEIIGSKNNFYYVITPDGRLGYMSKNFIDTGGEAVSQIAIVSNGNGGGFLNFRAQPSYSAQIIATLYNGTPLWVDGYVNGWYQVRVNHQAGFVSDQFIYVIKTVGSSQVGTIKTPNNTAVNLREGPGMAYSVIRQFSGDRYVMVLAKGKGWWRVSIDGYVGFISSDFLVDGLSGARDSSGQSQGAAGINNVYAYVNNPKSTQVLNLRVSANTGADILRRLANGTRLRVDRQGTEWCAVTAVDSGITGYVMTRYIKLVNLPEIPTLRVTHPQGLKVNVRSAPSFSANIFIQAPNYQNVTVLIPGDEWTKVQYNGYVGYMASCFLQ